MTAPAMQNTSSNAGTFVPRPAFIVYLRATFVHLGVAVGSPYFKFRRSKIRIAPAIAAAEYSSAYTVFSTTSLPATGFPCATDAITFSDAKFGTRYANPRLAHRIAPLTMPANE